MQKIKVAVIFGGNSPEHNVSLSSTYSVLKNINSTKYQIIPIGITKAGNWYHYLGDYEKICDGSWERDELNARKLIFSPDFSAPCFYEYTDNKWESLSVDLVFPVLHGKNGEDGSLQGMFELAGIPIVGCNTLSSALCMDKHRAHQLVSYHGIATPKAITINKKCEPDISGLRVPVFVKPVRAGSSFGISKVTEQKDLAAAIDLALKYDSEVIIEEAINGFEVGCAILGKDELTVGRVDEIETQDGFFDYEEKYTLKTAKIHVPARIDASIEKEIQETAKRIYKILGCSGFARIDMFLTPENKIVFNEANTIPGLTSHSQFPMMMKAIGLSFAEVLDKLLELYV